MDVVGQIALDHRYRFGYSFRNPRIIKRVTEVKPEPWFKMKWAPQGPTQVRAKIWKSGRLPEYPSVWRRAAKRVHVEKLEGYVSRLEMPSFYELGQAPGPTEKVPTTERGFWGLLENILIKTSDILVAREQAKTAKVQAEAAARLEPIKAGVFSTGETNMMPWLVGLGVLGIGAYMVFRR